MEALLLYHFNDYEHGGSKGVHIMQGYLSYSSDIGAAVPDCLASIYRSISSII